MCGICISVSFKGKSSTNACQVNEDVCMSLKRRGPDHFKAVSCCYNNDIDIKITSSVLHLRGEDPALQPIKNENGNLLAWNGEIFGGLEVPDISSDTHILSHLLFHSSSKTEVLSVLSAIEGPFAFIFYDKKAGLLWYGRDIFGRRSLLWNANENAFHLCSVANKQDSWKEVTTKGVYCIDLNESCHKKYFSAHLFSWCRSPSGLCLSPKSSLLTNDFISFKTVSDQLIDCKISISLNKHLPTAEVLKNFHVHKGKGLSEEELLLELLKLPELKEYVCQFEEVLSAAVQKRVHNHQHLCKTCHTSKHLEKSCPHASVGVLFSGGLDSIVIACLVDKHLKDNEEIDLMNVAFESSINLKSASNKTRESLFNTPDRLTGRKGLIALKRICRNRQWNFIEVNVSEDDLISHRKEAISHLLKPSCTVLDDSIGCALWFAAQGNGVVVTENGSTPYQSQSRVLLLGMGADEQLGGYSRHRGKFCSTGWKGLIEEISMELDRIGSRNLGRDDRIIADHGVESRYPFLDETVVSFLNSLPVWIKMNLNYPRGIGEKLLLRLLAFKLGLVEAAVLPKRAIQFGSRIAKIENSKEKGSDICERLKVTL